MANVDKPRGYLLGYTKHNGPAQVTTYKSTAAAIYPGDLVKKDGSGRILAITAVTDNPIGVAKSYGDATAGNDIFVYDDLVNTVFRTQVDDGTLADDTAIGNFFDTTFSTGNTVTLLSTQELDGDSSGDDTLTLVGLVDMTDNAWGEFVEVYVEVRVDANANVIATT